jgi:hypothetical protein
MIFYRRDAEGAEKKAIHLKGAKDAKIKLLKPVFSGRRQAIQD